MLRPFLEFQNILIAFICWDYYLLPCFALNQFQPYIIFWEKLNNLIISISIAPLRNELCRAALDEWNVDIDRVCIRLKVWRSVKTILSKWCFLPMNSTEILVKASERPSFMCIIEQMSPQCIVLRLILPQMRTLLLEYRRINKNIVVG